MIRVLIQIIFESTYTINKICKQMILKIVYGKQIHLTTTQDKPNFQQLKQFTTSHFKQLPPHFYLSYLDEQGDEISLNDQNDYKILLAGNAKSTRIIVQGTNQDFIDMTAKLTIDDLEDQPLIPGAIQGSEPVKEEQSFVEIEDSLIEEKIKKMMPGIISQIKSEVTQEMDSSRLSSNVSTFKKKEDKSTQPIIQEDKPESNHMKNEEKTEKKVEQPKEVIHRHIICDQCGKRGIVGIRYKCSVCPDYDLCETCEATSDHPHPFLKIKTLKQTPLKIFAVINDESQSNSESSGCPYRNRASRGCPFRSNASNGCPYRANASNGCPYRSNASNETSNENSQRTNASNGCPFRVPQGYENLANHGWNLMQGFLSGQRGPQMHENLQKMKEEWHKKKSEWGCGGRKRCQRQDSKHEEKPEKSCGMKNEEQEHSNRMKTQEESGRQSEHLQEQIIENANFLTQVFGYDFPKCLQWAQTYPEFSQEELLNICLENPEFHK